MELSIKVEIEVNGKMTEKKLNLDAESGRVIAKCGETLMETAIIEALDPGPIAAPEGHA